MIQLPDRAVTRFLVPFIDVLILLLCIFLLLPFVSTPAGQTATDTPTDLDALRTRLKTAERDLSIEQKRVEELLRERAESAQRTVVWVIDIDGDNGELSYAAPDGTPGKRFTIASADDARNFILNTKKKTDGRAVKYLFVCPRKAKPFPDRKTLDNIKAWFANESIHIDNPFDSR